MKKIYYFFRFNVLAILFLLIANITLQAQTPTYNCQILNITQMSCNVFEFDLYLQRTGTNPFIYANMQAAIFLNPQIVNGGTISVQPVPGSSQLPTNMQPGPTRFGYYHNTNVIAMTPVPPPGFANGFPITNIPPGVRVIRFRIINSVPFTNVSPNLAFNFDQYQYSYATKVAAYVNNINTIVTSSGTFIVPSNQPAFTSNFPAPVAQQVTGGGQICDVPGATGLPIGLSNSEVGFAYFLYRNGVQITTGGVMAGTGSAINFPLQTTPGIYTIKSVSCTGDVDMIGSAEITLISPQPATVSISANPGTIVLPSTPVTYTASFTNAGTTPFVQWYVNGVPDLVNGSGVTSYVYTPQNGDQISCELYPSSDACTQSTVVTSDTLSMLVGVCSNFASTTSAHICQGGTYTWRGNVYNATGVYYDSLITILPPGCDSVYVLNLTVHPNYEFITNASICQGQVYTWRGNTYSTAGTYTETLQTSLGCDSIYKLNLQVNPVYEFVTNAQICQGDVYVWRGNTYTTAGTYTDALVSSHGCDSIFKLNLVVNPTYLSTTNASICDGDEYIWEGISYSIQGTYTLNYQTNTGCDSIKILELTVYPVFEFVESAEICDGDSYYWQGNTYTNSDTYYQYYSTIHGCDSVYMLNLTVHNLPNVSFSGLGNFYCNYYAPVTMTGNPAGGSFSGQGVSGNVFSPSVAGTGTWTVTYTYTDVNGCTNSYSITVVVDECLSVNSPENSGFAVYPNPMSEMLTIELFSADNSENSWSLFDANGKLVLSGRQELQQGINYIHIDTKALPAGLYLLKSLTSGNLESVRIVKH